MTEVCEICGFEAKSKAGLVNHQKSCIETNKVNERIIELTESKGQITRIDNNSNENIPQETSKDNTGQIVKFNDERITRYIYYMYEGSTSVEIIADYSKDYEFIWNKKLYTLKKSNGTLEGKPLYYILDSFNYSITFKFSEFNRTLVEINETPADMYQIIRSQGVKAMFEAKEKFTYKHILTGLICSIISILGTIVVFYNLINAGFFK